MNGNDYDAIPANKPEWIRESGHFGGRFRDINEPFRSGYEEMAAAVITAYEAHLKAEGFVVVRAEPTDKMICAALDDYDKRGRGKQSYHNIYTAMIAAALEPSNASD